MSAAWVFVTSNESKWREAQLILGRPLERVSLELPELQAATTAEVALGKAQHAWMHLLRPVIVEDAGVELVALNGFPGPFIKYWEKLGGLASICSACDGLKDRRAVAVCALVACDANGPTLVEGRAEGSIAESPRGTNGFGWDAVFIPAGGTKTYAELTQAEKDARSHRRKAWDALTQRLR